MKFLKVPFCSACGKVKDEIGFAPPQKSWMDLRMYRTKYDFRFADLSLVPTYCLECSAFYQTVKAPHRPLLLSK